MKHLVSTQQWDRHTADKHVFIMDEIIVAMVTINHFEDYDTIESLWLEPQYRGRGLSKEIMDIITDNQPMTLMVRKDNEIAINLYKKYGFEYWCEEDENYDWYRNYTETKILNKNI